MHDTGKDEHLLPFYGGIDWFRVMKTLRDINYQGDFTYEADNFLVRFDKEALPYAVRFMADLGRTLIAKVDAARPTK